MSSLQKLRSYFLTMSFAAVLATVMAFGFGSADSWAATSPPQRIGQQQPQVTAMDRAETMTKNRAKKFDAKSLQGNINSIENPNYKPSGQSRESERQIRDSKTQVEAADRENLN
jgi:hypothetical protein